MSKHKFLRGLLIYSVVLLLIGGSFVGYVVYCLKDYEANQINTFAKQVLTSGQLESSAQLSDYETSKDINSALKQIVNETEIKVKETEKNHYIISADGIDIVQVVVDEGEQVTKLGVLNYSKLKLKEASFINEGALYSYEVQIPSTYTLVVNGNSVDSSVADGTEIIPGFKGSNSNNAPTVSVYKLSGFISKPEIVIKDESGSVVEPKVDKNKISSSSYFQTDDQQVAMSKLVESIDIMSLAKNYSLFMTNDLVGEKHGFGTLEPFFIEDTELYKQAYQWATGIDITFVSNHTFKNPMFSNERLEQFEVYSDKAFSVVVHLEKNMIISGKSKVDTINSRWYFVYDNGWKLVDMKHVNVGN